MRNAVNRFPSMPSFVQGVVVQRSMSDSHSNVAVRDMVNQRREAEGGVSGGPNIGDAVRSPLAEALAKDLTEQRREYVRYVFENHSLGGQPRGFGSPEVRRKCIYYSSERSNGGGIG